MDLTALTTRAIDGIERWQVTYGEFSAHDTVRVGDDAMAAALDGLLERLRDNYPFFHPRYAGQMLKPPHPAAIAGYLAAIQINPNAHALDGGPATAALEREVVADIAAMFGLVEHLGHLTSSGTIANLEALYVARELRPRAAVAYSADAHYTHGRMCGVLGIEGRAVAIDARGRIDLEDLDRVLRGGDVGTVVVTLGTTGVGAVDQLQDVLPIARAHDVRVHADAAYGGFFALLGRAGADPPASAHPETAHPDATVEPAPWLATGEVDSIVVDPHKHGLQPYGCGAVLFRDPEVGRFYAHDSPYTYFTSDELHLGEISLECSRAGAAAAALWLTLQVLPLTATAGLGDVLIACRRAALRFDQAIADSADFAVYQPAELDIVSYVDAHATTTSEVDAVSAALLQQAMRGADPVFVSTLAVSAADFARRHPHVSVDSDRVRVLRSVLMKPEHEDAVPWLVNRLTQVRRAL